MRKTLGNVALSVVLAVGFVSPTSLAWAADAATSAANTNTENVVATQGDDQGATDESATDETAVPPETTDDAATDPEASTDPGQSDAGEDEDSQTPDVNTITFDEGTYAICSADAPNECLDVVAGSKESGANVTLWEYYGSDWQKYNLVTDDEGFILIKNYNSGLCLGCSEAEPGLGSNVCQLTPQEGTHYQWVAEEDGYGMYRLRLRDTNLYLDVEGGHAADGVNVKLWDDTACNSRLGQSFRIDAILTRTIADGVYDLASLSDPNENVSIADDSTEDGANAITMYNLNKGSQKFQVTLLDDGYYSIRSVATGMALDVVASGQEAGTNVTQWTWTGADNQRWEFVREDDGTYSIRSKCNGLYLDVEGGQASDWVNVRMWTKSDNNGGKGQHFRLDAAIDDGYYLLRSADNNDYVADVVASSTDDGANVTLWNYTGALNQKYQIYHLYANYYKIVNCNSWKALDVEGGGTADGTNVSQWSQYDTDNQAWELVGNDDGTYSFRAKCSGLFLDVQGGYAGAGANLQTWEATDNNSGLGQKFNLEVTAIDFCDMISEFSTVSTNTANGTYNMTRALSSFDGVIIQPGETLSFFAVAGPCGEAQGYLPAGIVGGIGYGGGICQASTTLYGAAIRAGFDIVERQNHSTPSTYVPIGQDAMVDYGSSDLKIRNPYNFPVKIKVIIDGNTLICQMWGIQPNWFDTVEVNSWYTSSNTAAAQRTFIKNGVAVRVDDLPSSTY